MLVMGIDPGTATTGWGLIRINSNEDFEVIQFGLIETHKLATPEKRLQDIYERMIELLDIYVPNVMAIEKVFFSNNAKTAIRVGQAQGVMLLSAATKQVPVAEYAPGTIKKVLTGNGRADKKEVQKTLRVLFGPKIRSQAHKKTHFDNAADALAVAFCHLKHQSL